MSAPARAPAESARELEAEIAACRACAGRFAATRTAHAPRPVTRISTTAKLLIAGQAPGARVHASGLPFDDRSGDRLRDWLGIDRPTFYDRDRVAILPMAFCFPGYDARGADLPPPPLCAELWRARALAAMPQVELTLLIGAHAQAWALNGKRPLTQRVRDWRDHLPHLIPMPHPSWRNTGWLRRNPWFEEELVPWLRARVSELL
ncbi:uracil-DNA glycosylase family protein [Albimonas sp. CAU 1670]|uniref:uracil-DNA glycosylase family protein n=1 Tax=Albimonas sp. CAU 1670 TaxID=3032599 RepID=UPI0023DCA371|nr:uracil-DNA glycosylase family protein [Albimonas sp. CAU 1670]MDF2233286.1 uracil-DNA glycosylase family protein [Albimonas sp. CAU 1670]